MEVFENKPLKVKEFLNKYFLTDGIIFELIEKQDELITKIDNPIILSSPPNKGLIKIALQDYLKDIEGYALIKNKSNFITNFEEIEFTGTLYKYNDEEGFLEVTDISSLLIDDYVNDKEIKYITIPIVESSYEDDFLNGMKFTDDDVKEVINKMDRELMWISVIVPKDYQGSLPDDVIDSRDYVFDNLGFEELVEIGHSRHCKTMSFVKTIKLFEGRKNNLYLPFNKRATSPSYWYFRNDKRQDIFMRSVLIKDLIFRIPVSASIFEIDTLIANINSKKFIPDISRNNVDTKANDIVNYILGKAIHIGACDVLNLKPDEKATLQNFVKTFYNEKTEFEK